MTKPNSQEVKSETNAKPSGKKKLSPEEVAIVIKMLASFHSNQQVLDYLQEKYDHRFSSAAITHYRNNYQKEIEDCRKDFLKLVEVVPLIDKTARIVMRQKMIYNLAGAIDNDVDAEPKRLWLEEFSAKTGMKIKEHGNHAVVNQLLDSIQAEVEPRRMSLTDPDGKGDQMEKLLNHLAVRDRKAEEMVNLSLTLLKKRPESEPAKPVSKHASKQKRKS